MAPPADQAGRPIGYWLSHVHELLESTLDAQLATEKLTRRHWQVLNTVATAPATAAALNDALQPFLDDDHPTLAPVLRDLGERDWLVTNASGVIGLSTKGKQAHARVRELVTAYRARCREGIGDEDYIRTVRTLSRMAQNLEAMDNRRGPTGTSMA